MVRKEILTLLNEICGAYPNINIKDPQTTARMWEMALGEYEAKYIFMAARIHIRKSKYFPSPNSLIELIPKAKMLCEMEEEKMKNNGGNIEPPKAPVKLISSGAYCSGSCICPYYESDLCGGTKEEYDVCKI